MKLKEGIIIRPHGPLSELKGEVGPHVGKYLIKKGLATSESFESESDQVDLEEAIRQAEEAEAKAKKEELAPKPAPKRRTRKKK